MSTNDLHIEWTMCSDWVAVRAKLEFLGVTLFGNFAYLCDDPDLDEIVERLEASGFIVTVEPYHGERLLRLKDAGGAS